MLTRLTINRRGVILYLAAALLGLVAPVSAQQPPVVTFPAGPVTVTVPAAFTLEQGPGFITLRWAAQPGPIPPTPTPTPTPGPTPTPTPTPTPVDPAPIPDAGLRVMVVYETASLSKMPREQLGILYDQGFRDWLSGIVVKGVDGKTPEWRVYDQHADIAAESPLWRAALARPRKAVPWLVVSNGKAGFEGPLPANVADAKTVIQRFVQP